MTPISANRALLIAVASKLSEGSRHKGLLQIKIPDRLEITATMNDPHEQNIIGTHFVKHEILANR